MCLLFCSPKDWDDVIEVLRSELGSNFLIHGRFFFHCQFSYVKEGGLFVLFVSRRLRFIRHMRYGWKSLGDEGVQAWFHIM